MLFFNANFICYYFYPTKKREEPFYMSLLLKIQIKKRLESKMVSSLFSFAASIQ